MDWVGRQGHKVIIWALNPTEQVLSLFWHATTPQTTQPYSIGSSSLSLHLPDGLLPLAPTFTIHKTDLRKPYPSPGHQRILLPPSNRLPPFAVLREPSHGASTALDVVAAQLPRRRNVNTILLKRGALIPILVALVFLIWKKACLNLTANFIADSPISMLNSLIGVILM
ncbi:predicted protein [Plenodomus lingam JN3]|uniref:Predicted protein n=1 Tax=Leptosphaeria maculans (strain JN3 / isolate v23.1.3 / race Av1-4-5-6-7-8) TaxID=985895 RepID=E5ACB1_LEPMJ|nr:predicted protein [Plenodomus lingam JN3]CBY02113.1 predicted protein [Plenodomus lingam JN3]